MRVSSVRSALVLAAVPLIGSVCAGALIVSTAWAGTPNPPSVKRIAPISAPAGTSITIVIHGHRFDTTAGAITVTFGGVPAVSVYCSSPSLCQAVTPNLSAGPVSVVVTTDSTPLNPETLTVTPYAAPVVRLVLNARSHTVFSVSHLIDSYPAAGGPGYDAVTIENTTSVEQTVNSIAVGATTIDPGDSATLALAADNGPYVLTTSGTPTASLTVRTHTPA